MNAPIRRLGTVVALLFTALLLSTTIIQVLLAPSLNAREDNRRTLLSTYSRDRGAILVRDTAVAKSVPTSNEFKFLRTYPDGKAYAHVTGYFSYWGAGGGLESTENALLSGRSDKLFYRRISDVFTGRKPQGASLELTLNPRVQKAAIKAFGDQRGAAVALDPRTGAILALVSLPSYNPAELSSQDFDKAAAASKRLNEDPARPLVNRATQGDLYPPGSTFKLVTAAAALTSGKFDLDSTLPGPAKLKLPQTSITLDNPSGSCGPGDKTTLLLAMQSSCNTAFAWLGMEVGQDALREQAQKFGVGDSLAIPMPVTPSVFPTNLNAPQTAQSAIGAYEVRMTPLQLALVSAGIANKGAVMRPYLVQSVLTQDLKIIDQASAEQLSTAVTPEVAAKLTQMMEAVVASGTGTRAQIPGIRVAGKTGTAQYLKGKPPHAWFTAFAPADDPRIAVAVVVENGGQLGSEASGGRVAAPIAQAMMTALLSQGGAQ